MCANAGEVQQHIDPTRPVKVYRNLHKNCISVQQDGLVKCHANHVLLRDGTFVVNEKGRDKVREKKQKNVHAYIIGMAVKAEAADLADGTDWTGAYYNPYTCDTWQDLDTKLPILGGLYIDIEIDQDNSDVFVKQVNYV